jgi:hypothetical protein
MNPIPTDWRGAPPGRQGLYDPANEHDSCGLGFIAHIRGRKSHAIIDQGLEILKNLSHRGAGLTPERRRRRPDPASTRFCAVFADARA